LKEVETMNPGSNRIRLDYTRVMKHVTREDIEKLAPQVAKAQEMIQKKDGPGGEFLGWVDLPSRVDAKEIEEIQKCAFEISGNSEVFLIIGIGGSYLGARAVLSALMSPFHNETGISGGPQIPRIYYAGADISSDHTAELLDVMKVRRVTINVISKSGTTTEPALAFRIIKDNIIKKIGKEEAKRRVIATTDKARGSLKTLADREGYKTFVIPDDVGGRFSVLTPVGLLPIAVGGIDIKELLKGAADMALLCREPDLFKNAACMYAVIRNVLLEKGRGIEVLASFEPCLHYVGEWWKQLFGESEGKEHKGIFPASLDFTTDLHSMGQWIQEGVRSLFETFLWIEEEKKEVLIPEEEQNLDNLNYLVGKSLHYVNANAHEGVASAHLEGDVPNMTIKIPKLDAYNLGQLLYFFEYAVAVSGYILGVNPFDQPGVENYKKNMFALLGKPGFEAQAAAIRKASAGGAHCEV
jgi:glucose-6-phosphate isomerase